MRRFLIDICVFSASLAFRVGSKGQWEESFSASAGWRRLRKSVAILSVLVCAVGGPAPRTVADDDVPRYDAQELDSELNGNEIKARAFQGKTIEVTGRFWSNKLVKNPSGKEAVIVTYQGFGGVFECIHVKCLVYDMNRVKALKRGDEITLRGKVVLVVRDNIAINAQVVPPPNAQVVPPPRPKPSDPREIILDPKDSAETFRWLFTRSTELRRQEIPARNAVRENALNNEQLKKFEGDFLALRDEINRQKGKEIRWKAKVRQIDPKGVWVESHQVRTFEPSLFNRVGPGPDADTRRLFKMTQPGFVLDPSVVMDVYFRRPRFPELIHSSKGESYIAIDTGISLNYAKTLKPGQEITIRANLVEAMAGIDSNAGIYRFAIFVEPQIEDVGNRDGDGAALPPRLTRPHPKIRDFCSGVRENVAIAQAREVVCHHGAGQAEQSSSATNATGQDIASDVRERVFKRITTGGLSARVASGVRYLNEDRGCHQENRSGTHAKIYNGCLDRRHSQIAGLCRSCPPWESMRKL